MKTKGAPTGRMDEILALGSGASRIATERQRQIEVERFTPEHDDKHETGDLAMAAACYAAPGQIYAVNADANGFTFFDPWPWEATWDRRYKLGKQEEADSDELPDPSTYTDEQRIELLTKAGALCAAEIDRLLRKAFSGTLKPGESRE